MDDPIGQVEAELEETARKCLRLSGTRTLTAGKRHQLAKWMFGCMNQRVHIRERVAKRGVGELAKVLEFVSEACQFLLELDPPREDETPDDDDQ